MSRDKIIYNKYLYIKISQFINDKIILLLLLLCKIIYKNYFIIYPKNWTHFNI